MTFLCDKHYMQGTSVALASKMPEVILTKYGPKEPHEQSAASCNNPTAHSQLLTFEPTCYKSREYRYSPTRHTVATNCWQVIDVVHVSNWLLPYTHLISRNIPSNAPSQNFVEFKIRSSLSRSLATYRIATNFQGVKFSWFRGFHSNRENYTLENFTPLKFYTTSLARAKFT